MRKCKNDETPGKYIHTKKKNRKTLFFLSGKGSVEPQP
jgi:hypothetical protein